jgi:hypothetical protein
MSRSISVLSLGNMVRKRDRHTDRKKTIEGRKLRDEIGNA